MGDLPTAGRDQLVEHALLDAEEGLAVRLSVYYHRKRPRAVERLYDPGVQCLLDVLLDGTIVAGVHAARVVIDGRLVIQL